MHAVIYKRLSGRLCKCETCECKTF